MYGPVFQLQEAPASITTTEFSKSVCANPLIPVHSPEERPKPSTRIDSITPCENGLERPNLSCTVSTPQLASSRAMIANGAWRSKYEPRTGTATSICSSRLILAFSEAAGSRLGLPSRSGRRPEPRPGIGGEHRWQRRRIRFESCLPYDPCQLSTRHRCFRKPGLILAAQTANLVPHPNPGLRWGPDHWALILPVELFLDLMRFLVRAGGRECEC